MQIHCFIKAPLQCGWVVFYCFIGIKTGFCCSSEINGYIPENHVFLRKTRHFRRAHPYVVDPPPIPYGQNSFFIRTIRVWNLLLPEIVIFAFKE